MMPDPGAAVPSVVPVWLQSQVQNSLDGFQLGGIGEYFVNCRFSLVAVARRGSS